MQFEDCAIDAGGQPKIVGVDNETCHGVSVSTAPEADGRGSEDSGVSAVSGVCGVGARERIGEQRR